MAHMSLIPSGCWARLRALGPLPVPTLSMVISMVELGGRGGARAELGADSGAVGDLQRGKQEE